MNDWNPEQYVKFKNERTQPSIDLISKIKINYPEFIIDMGCGPGNSTQIQALLSVSLEKKWYQFTNGCENLLNYQKAEYYYNLLNPLASVLDIWETVYYHILPSHQGLIDWYKSTGMRPFLERLPNEEKKAEFEIEVLEKCRDVYPIQKNGNVLYPFKRIFFIACN
jgi:trans-aconitate methyltransferase